MALKATVNLRVFYPAKNKSTVVVGARDKIYEEIKKKLDLRSHFIMYMEDYAGRWVKATAVTVKDCAEVRIRLKEEPESIIGAVNEEAIKEVMFRESVKKKLTGNVLLTGKDREYLCRLLDKEDNIILQDIDSKPSTSLAKKRRLSNVDCSVEEADKPVEAFPVRRERKDSDADSNSSTETVKVGPRMCDAETQTDLKLVDNSQLIMHLKKQAALPPASQSKADIEKIMSFTFGERRDFILNKMPSLRSIKEEYPTLFDKKQLIAEFGRIRGYDVQTVYYKNLDRCCLSIIRKSSSCPLKTLVKECAKEANSEESQKYFNFAGALLLLSSLFDKDVDALTKFNAKLPQTEYPIILCKSSAESVLNDKPLFKIYAENLFLFDTVDYVEAVLLLMAVHFCFDMEYPKDFSKIAQLIELLLLDIKLESGSSVSSKVKSLYSALKG